MTKNEDGFIPFEYQDTQSELPSGDHNETDSKINPGIEEVGDNIYSNCNGNNDS